MEITTRMEGAAASVSVSGEMNIYSVLEGKGPLMDAVLGREDVAVDLSGVSEFDSAGLQLVLLAWREKEKTGKRPTLSASSAQVDAVIELYNLKGFFEGKARVEA